MASTKKGFSLIETIVVMGLVSITLFGVAELTKRTLDTQKFLRKKSESIQSATLGCERLASEMREAITLPSTGGTSSWKKVTPSQPEVMDIPVPSIAQIPASPTWDRSYHQPTKLTTVTYSVTADSLKRQVTGSAEATVATDVNSFIVEAVPDRDRTFLIRLAINEQHKVQTFLAEVYCPGIP